MLKQKFVLGSVLIVALAVMVINAGTGNPSGMSLSVKSHAADSSDEYFDKYGRFNKAEWEKLDTGIWKNKSTGGRVVFSEPFSGKFVGYNDIIPLLIHINNKDVIKKIEVLPNRETPSYMARIERRGMIDQYIGVSVDDIMGLSVDTVSAATMSSSAIQSSIKGALLAYIKIISQK